MSENVNDCFEEVALKWNERQEHARIMEMIEEEVDGRYNQRTCQCGFCYHWKVRVLTERQLELIVKRANHIEIMKLIKKYGEASIPLDRAHVGCTACGIQKPESAILPEDVQKFIALRNNKEEIDLYLSFFGFGEKGQNVVLGRGDHDELMYYIDRHGFLAEQQRRLIERGNVDEIELHIRRHGLADELLDELFEDMKEGKEIGEFYRFINNHELNVKYQKEMIKVVKSHEFRSYVDRYGLWEETHEDLLKYRSIEDVSYYIHRHQYLGTEAEESFYFKASREDLIYYLRHKGEPVNINNLLRNILYDYAGENGCDREVLTEAFLRVCPSYYERRDVLDKIRNGSRDEVLELVSDSSNVLTAFALATLFFRNETKLFEKYLKSHSTYFC